MEPLLHWGEAKRPWSGYERVCCTLEHMELHFGSATQHVRRTFSGFSVDSCINEEEGYLLPTLARKISCQRFD